MNFVGIGKTALRVSMAMVIVAIVILVFRGLNLGIDFTGGSIMERQVDQSVTVEEIRTVLSNEVGELGVADGVIQILDRSDQFLLRTRTLETSEIMQIDAALDAAFGGLQERRTDMVGPVIGQELVRQALWALLIAAVGILAYVSVRFEFRFAGSAIAAVLHDVLFVLAVFAITGREINSPFVAAILTVVGYSINDTIVIFDKVRENLRFRKRETLEEVVNNSLNETLPRSINTSMTTFVVILMLFVFGDASISDFAFALLVGVLVGTYSSLFVASPVWLEWTLGAQKKPAQR